MLSTLKNSASDEDLSEFFNGDVFSDDEYEYESDQAVESEDGAEAEADVEAEADAEEVKTIEINPTSADVSDDLGACHISSALVDQRRGRGRGRCRGLAEDHRGSSPRMINNWFTNIGSTMGLNHRPSVKKVAYIFKNGGDRMKCDLTVNDETEFGKTNFDIQIKRNSIDTFRFSLGSGETFSFNPQYTKWILNDYEPHMWREVGIHVYVMFDKDWSCLSHMRAKAVINACLEIWNEIKKEVYITFCEIVLEREYSDERPVPDDLKTQINRAMWCESVKEPFTVGFKAFRGWYQSRLLKLFEEEEKIKALDDDKQDELFHHMYDFCGLYTMNNRSNNVLTNVAGIA